MLKEFHVDDQERLWVLSAVADANWQQQAREAAARAEPAIRDLDAYYDTRLDVFDLRNGIHYGPHQWDAYRMHLVPHGSGVMVSHVELDAELRPYLLLSGVNVRDR
jgi:hypothetical protein